MSIGANVHRLRQERSISQSALADVINVHQTHISAIERGEKTPSLEVAQQLASYFGVSLDELVKGPSSVPQPQLVQ